MTTAVVIQARTASTRLPGKVLLPLQGGTVLSRMIERVQAATTPFEIVIATTPDTADDAIVAIARRTGVRHYRGHPDDLLDRHVGAARSIAADVVVKIPSDCPLIDPAVIDRVLGAFDGSVDFASNLHPATYPDGNDVEVMALEALETAHREATRPLEREHTTPFLWERPERFRLRNVVWETGLDYSMSHRFTIDYAEDYRFIQAVYGALYDEGRVFSLAEILTLVDGRPDMFSINRRFAGVNWYRHHLGELRTVSRDQTRIAP